MLGGSHSSRSVQRRPIHEVPPEQASGINGKVDRKQLVALIPEVQAVPVTMWSSQPVGQEAVEASSLLHWCICVCSLWGYSPPSLLIHNGRHCPDHMSLEGFAEGCNSHLLPSLPIYCIFAFPNFFYFYSHQFAFTFTFAFPGSCSASASAAQQSQGIDWSL